MKPAFTFVLVLAVQTATICSQRVTLIGSHLLPTDSSYKAFLSTNNLGVRSSVDVSLFASNSPTYKNLQVPVEGSFNEVEFQTIPESNDYELKVSPKSSNKCSSAKLIKTSDRPLIFIQFTKPFYKIGDDFSFRIFFLNQKMLPYKGTQSINVKILDSRNGIFKKFDNIEISEFGVYENTFKLSDIQNLGKWKIQVESADRKVTKRFNVEQPNRDNLEIFIEMAPMLSYSDKRAYMNIYVKDRSNKFFTGVAKIYVSGKLKESTRTDFGRKLVKTIELVGRKNGVGINYDEDIGISPPSDMMLNFDVEVIDPVTKRFIKTSKTVELKSNSRNTIHLVKKKFFKPGFKFPMKVKVKTLDGSPDNSFNKLSMTVEYHNKGSGIDKKQFQLNLKNGEISAPLNPTSDTTNIIVNFEFSGAKLTEIIDPLPTMGANEYMQVTVTSKANTVGDKVKYQVQTTEEMESLHVLVIGINGIVHYEEYPDAVGKDLFDFSVQLTEEMKPESRGIAFYIRPSDGILVYDEFVVTVTFGIENLLEISAPEAGKPNEQIDFNVKTLKGSKVFLTATDQISPLLIRDNEISRSDIYNELIYYLNYRFPNTSLYNFEKFNGFILQPLTEGHTCRGESAEYTTNEESDDEENLNSEAKYFPNVWFDKSFDATSDAITPYSVKLPNSLTTWRYYGISVHKTKGFTVAKIQPKTAVKSEIVVQVKAPPTISDNEIVWVDVNVFNTMQENLRSDVLINIENGVIVEVNDVREFNLLCTKFTTRNQKDVKLVKNLLPQKKTEIIKIPIKSTGNGHIKVKVKAIAGNYNDEATKTIAFENAEEPAHTNNNFETNVYTQELQNSQVKIEIEGKVLRKGIKSSNTIVLDVELPRGFKYITHEENDKIDYFEVQDDSSIIVFYLKNLRPNQIFKQVIKAAKVYDFDVHKPSMVFSYDLNLPDEKDVTYYSFDKNTERCDKIEVMKWKNKALDAQGITKEAQESVKKSRDKITKAQQNLANAQNKLKQAENKVKEAEQKALEADIKSQDAFKKAEDAWHDAEQARQTKPKNVVQSVPNNSIEEPVNETPTNAADAQKIAKAAQELADKAQNEAVEAQDGVTSANDEFETAKQEAKKALQDLIDAQKDANKSSNEVKELQKDTNAVKAEVNNAQNKVKTAQQNVANAQKDVDEATAEVNKIQHEIDGALQVVSNAINKANKATKYTDIEQDVLNAEKISQEAKTFAQKANRVENDIVQKIQRPSSAVDQEIENVQKLFSYCNSLFIKAVSINNGATKVQQIISSSVFIFTNNVERFENARQKFVDAEQLAKVTKEKADRLRQYSQRKAADASNLATLEQSTRRTTSRFPSRYTTKYPTYTSSLQNIPTKTSQHWQPQSTSNQQWNPQPTPAIITTTQFYLQDVQDEYYQPNGDNRNVQSTGQSDITACSKWYRFCSFGL